MWGFDFQPCLVGVPREHDRPSYGGVAKSERMTELVYCDRHQAICLVTLAGIRKASNIRFLGKPQLVRVEVNVATATTTRKKRVGENRTRPVCSKDMLYCVQESSDHYGLTKGIPVTVKPSMKMNCKR